MKKYIEQLLEDLRAAHHTEEGVAQVELNEQTFEAHMEEIENWVSGNLPPSSFAGQSNIDQNRFPAPDQLTEEEMEAVIAGIEGLFGSWNNSIDFREGMPTPLRYTLAVSLMAEDAFYVASGMIHHDFCTGYAPDCELGEYCGCKQYWKDA
jgi:hypothetical protein